MSLKKVKGGEDDKHLRITSNGSRNGGKEGRYGVLGRRSWDPFDIEKWYSRFVNQYRCRRVFFPRKESTSTRTILES